jgi:hypothetical protein
MLFIAVFLGGWVSLCGFGVAQERKSRGELSPHIRLKSVSLDDVRWIDGFWAQRFDQ